MLRMKTEGKRIVKGLYFASGFGSVCKLSVGIWLGNEARAEDLRHICQGWPALQQH
jgi:hypothetical protein